jgi:hypothetical protein
MKTAIATILVLIALLVPGTSVLADEKGIEHGATIILPLGGELGRAVGDDCTNPIIIPVLPYSDLNQTNCARLNDYTETCLGYYDGGEDIIYEMTITAATAVAITMDPLGATWTGVALDDACPPDGSCIAISTGSSGIRYITANLDPGTYYIMVDTWPAPTCIPAFNLTIEEVEPYPNPTCETAIDLCEQGLTTFTVNTCGSVGDYSPTNSCTGYSAGAAGEDAVYKIYLTTGETFAVDLTGESYDASIYLLTDCSDMNSCVAGGDDPESFSYVATADGWYYLMIDGYASGGCGTSTVNVVMPPTATNSATWGTLKGLYR